MPGRDDISGPPARQPRIAPSPFNKPEADIILRSSDLVDFYVRRHILVEASPVFESIFSIPQPPRDAEKASDHPPVVDLAEDHKTLEILLTICYPVVKPKSHGSREEIEGALKAAVKYDMRLSIAALCDEILDATKDSPVRAWAIACQLNMEELASQAAILTLQLSHSELQAAVGEHLRVMDGISAGQYFRLLEFHRRRGQPDKVSSLVNPRSCISPRSLLGPDQRSSSLEFPPSEHTDLACISSTGTVLYTCSELVARASPVLSEKIKIARRALGDVQSELSSPLPGNDTLIAEGHLVLPFDEDGEALTILLRLCQEQPKLPLNTLDTAYSFKIVEKYKIDGVRDSLPPLWDNVVFSYPLLAYFDALWVGLPSLAQKAAIRVIESGYVEDKYISAMEYVDALPYHHLLERAAQRRSKIAQLFDHTGADLFPYWKGFTDAAGANASSIDDANTWLRSYLASLLQWTIQHPSLWRSSPLAAAVQAHQWCPKCKPLAEALVRVEKTLQEISRVNAEVTRDPLDI